ncbi:MAG TPA: hypothetical protein ENK02_10950 [Planctomycetes bacterium]|nr:hypothetical protein [Planctomycetota bacterium]
MGQNPTKKMAAITLGALLFGELVGAGAVLFFRLQGNFHPDLNGTENQLELIAIVFGLTMIPGGFLFRRFLAAKAEGRSGLDGAQARYAAFLIPVTLVEAAFLFAIVVWLLAPESSAAPTLAVLLFLATLYLGWTGVRLVGEEDE